jgi:hypothetical protein
MLEYKKNLKNINLHFISENNSMFDVTLWIVYKNDEMNFNVQNNSKQPLLDFILYIDKICKTEEDLLTSRHTLEILFGTIPSNMTLTHNESQAIFLDDLFGYPLLSGQFSDKQGRHWIVNESMNISEIDYRSPFD